MTDQGLFDWNDDLSNELEKINLDELVVYSRDWTVETIIGQIEKKNIDLNPAFQRRNAWTDLRRSLLIESLIVGIPVPEIVLAEEKHKKRSFIVLDGKQRLLTLAGFFDHNLPYWDKPELQGLQTLAMINGCTFNDIQSRSDLEDIHRSLVNSDIRCTIITNYPDSSVLYDIFYRLNTGSVPLGAQELRQVLNKGPFADYLISITENDSPIRSVLGNRGPDPRLRDVELILRFMCFELFRENYRGSIKHFLDESMSAVSNEWNRFEHQVAQLFEDFNETLLLAIDLLEFPKRVGRPYLDNKWSSRFNKSLFEVEMFYFKRARGTALSSRKNIFTDRLIDLCGDPEFRRSIQTTTKSLQNYRSRWSKFENLINGILDEHFSFSDF